MYAKRKPVIMYEVWTHDDGIICVTREKHIAEARAREHGGTVKKVRVIQ